MMVGPLPWRAVQDSSSSRLQRSEGQAGLTNNPETSFTCFELDFRNNRNMAYYPRRLYDLNGRHEDFVWFCS
jgi:hypothetical protein